MVVIRARFYVKEPNCERIDNYEQLWPELLENSDRASAAPLKQAAGPMVSKCLLCSGISVVNKVADIDK